MLSRKEEFSHFRSWGIGVRVADRGAESVCVGGSFVIELDRQRGSGGSDCVWALSISNRSIVDGETYDYSIQ